MSLIQNAIIFTVLFNLTYCQLELKLKNGTIRGQILKSRSGRNYYSYTSIPYAKPPIGKLRFKAPEPVEAWKGTLNATKVANICVQLGTTLGTEDCLYLNVFTPETNKTLLPVMVWIHGGGFFLGSGNAAEAGPEFFMDKDVIIVTMNYRLGLLGFLSTEDHVIPGNFGLKDQTQALRWVKENIFYFNGDAEQVTIFGGSAGSASTGFHLLSPLSKGLFHKAILESGAPTCTWAIGAQGIPRSRAYSVAIMAGCHVDTSENILDCLRKLPAQYLEDMQLKLYTWLIFPIAIFNPVVEDCHADHKGFLCNHPIHDFKQESFVPVITGTNTAEGGAFVSVLFNSSGTGLKYPEFQTDFNRLMSIIADYNYYTRPEYIDYIGRKIHERYFPDGNITDLAAVKLFTEAIFSHCVMHMAYKLASPVYSYIYDYQNSFSFNSNYGWTGKPLGVTHGDEAQSLFTFNIVNPAGLSKNDTEVSKVMINIWYKFASSKVPTIDGQNNGTVWPEFVTIDSPLMTINSTKPTIIKNPLVDSYKFWYDLPIY